MSWLEDQIVGELDKKAHVPVHFFSQEINERAINQTGNFALSDSLAVRIRFSDKH